MQKALSCPAQSHQSLDGRPHKDHLMVFAEHCGRPCLFHIQSNLSNQPTHTHWLSLEVDSVITAIKFDVKNSHTLVWLASLLKKEAVHYTLAPLYNKCSSYCLSRCTKDTLLQGLHTEYCWLIPHRMIKNNCIGKSKVLSTFSDSTAIVNTAKQPSIFHDCKYTMQWLCVYEA